MNAGARRWLWATAVLTVGGLVAGVVLAPPQSAPPAAALIWVLFLGSSVHVASTGWLFGLPEIRQYARRRPGRYLWVPAGLVVGAAVLAAALPPRAASWLLLPYFGWQFFHFQKQNLGIASLAASSERVRSLRAAERRALIGSGLAGIVGLAARPGLLQLGIEAGLEPLFAAAVAVFAVSAAAGVVVLRRRRPADRPPGFTAAYLIALSFPLPILAFRSPYAAVGGMTIAHGLQYLLLLGLVAAGRRRDAFRALPVAILLAVGLCGGGLLSVASHLHNSAPALRLLFGASIGLTMAHFVVDAGIWRLRDPFPRQFLADHLPYLVTPRRSAGSVASSSDIPCNGVPTPPSRA